jgi:Domain of unknown function (DUF4167)
MSQGSNPRRSRGRGPRKPHNPSRRQNFDNGGGDMRVRGNAYQVMEKYLALARDASAAGDRIAMENYLQHAEHYYRVLNANGEAHRGRPQEVRREGGHGPNGTQPAEGFDGQPDSEGQPKATAITEPADDSDA